jgi:DoxX-like family
MAVAVQAESLAVSKGAIWTGRVISGFVILFLLFDAAIKLMRIAPVMQSFAQFGFSPNVAIPIGAVLLVCTLVYLTPRTSVLGAILVTGYLGGAICTHVRAGQPFYFPLAFGVLAWVGLYLRDDRIRKLIPLN